jgi:glycosyltransferase involved in cell wall biosynthesis
MRILVLSSFFPPEAVGGLERSAFEAALGLHGRGHDVEVLTCAWRGAAKTEEAPFPVHRQLGYSDPAQYYGHRLRTLPRRLRDAVKNAEVGRANLRLMHDFLNERSFDVVSVWAFSGIGMALTLAATASGVPVVWHVGDLNLRERIYPHWVNSLIYTLSDSSWMRLEQSVDVRHVLVNSQFTRRLYLERGFSPESLEVIYRGVQADVVLETPLKRAVPRYLFMACRITPQKGVIDAIRALAILRRMKDTEDIELHIAGDGEIPYVADLKATAAKLGVADAVKFLGPAPRSTVIGWMREAAIVVSASRYEEYFGRVNIEAMASATPLLVSDTENVREIGEDGNHLITFRQCDPDDLATKAHWLLSDQALSSRLVRAATERVKSTFLQDVIDAKIEDYYGRLARRDAQRASA